jgi:eukaryotic-like serine/threonine-protein kinase
MTMEGTVLADRYAVGELLGRGGMAEVYLGTDRVLDRPVAVKVLGSWLVDDGTFVERFRREARAAARISHPNIVAVYDTGSEDGIHYIVMELVPGETLADVLRSEGHLASERATRIARSVADALAVAHAAGIVHRDVKPANVMLTRNGGAKLTDLGIARSLEGESITRASTILGTAGYLSPEQARGDRVDHRSDIYSLGCVMYEMLTGRQPFEADSPVAVAYKHVHEDPSPPSSVEPSVPPALDAVTMRAMAKDPAARFQAAEEMATAMDEDTVPVRPAAAATTPLPVTEPTQRLPRRVDRSRRRRPLVPILVGLAVVALLAWLAFALPDSEPRAGLQAGSPSPSKSTSPTPTTPPPTTPAPPPAPASVEEALTALDALVAAGLEEGTISDGAAEEIRGRVSDALGEFQDGDTDKAIEELEDLRDKVAEAVDHDEIAHSQKQKLDKAIEDLEEQMLLAAPPDEE